MLQGKKYTVHFSHFVFLPNGENLADNFKPNCPDVKPSIAEFAVSILCGVVCLRDNK